MAEASSGIMSASDKSSLHNWEADLVRKESSLRTILGSKSLPPEYDSVSSQVEKRLKETKENLIDLWGLPYHFQSRIFGDQIEKVPNEHIARNAASEYRTNVRSFEISQAGQQGEILSNRHILGQMQKEDRPSEKEKEELENAVLARKKRALVCSQVHQILDSFLDDVVVLVKQEPSSQAGNNETLTKTNSRTDAGEESEDSKDTQITEQTGIDKDLQIEVLKGHLIRRNKVCAEQRTAYLKELTVLRDQLFRKETLSEQAEDWGALFEDPDRAIDSKYLIRSNVSLPDFGSFLGSSSRYGQDPNDLDEFARSNMTTRTIAQLKREMNAEKVKLKLALEKEFQTRIGILKQQIQIKDKEYQGILDEAKKEIQIEKDEREVEVMRIQSELETSERMRLSETRELESQHREEMKKLAEEIGVETDEEKEQLRERLDAMRMEFRERLTDANQKIREADNEARRLKSLLDRRKEELAQHFSQVSPFQQLSDSISDTEALEQEKVKTGQMQKRLKRAAVKVESYQKLEQEMKEEIEELRDTLKGVTEERDSLKKSHLEGVDKSVGLQIQLESAAEHLEKAKREKWSVESRSSNQTDELIYKLKAAEQTISKNVKEMEKKSREYRVVLRQLEDTDQRLEEFTVQKEEDMAAWRREMTRQMQKRDRKKREQELADQQRIHKPEQRKAEEPKRRKRQGSKGVPPLKDLSQKVSAGKQKPEKHRRPTSARAHHSPNVPLRVRTQHRRHSVAPVPGSNEQQKILERFAAQQGKPILPPDDVGHEKKERKDQKKRDVKEQPEVSKAAPKKKRGEGKEQLRLPSESGGHSLKFTPDTGSEETNSAHDPVGHEPPSEKIESEKEHAEELGGKPVKEETGHKEIGPDQKGTEEKKGVVLSSKRDDPEEKEREPVFSDEKPIGDVEEEGQMEDELEVISEEPLRVLEDEKREGSETIDHQLSKVVIPPEIEITFAQPQEHREVVGLEDSDVVSEGTDYSEDEHVSEEEEVEPEEQQRGDDGGEGKEESPSSERQDGIQTTGGQDERTIEPPVETHDQGVQCLPPRASNQAVQCVQIIHDRGVQCTPPTMDELRIRHMEQEIEELQKENNFLKTVMYQREREKEMELITEEALKGPPNHSPLPKPPRKTPILPQRRRKPIWSENHQNQPNAKQQSQLQRRITSPTSSLMSTTSYNASKPAPITVTMERTTLSVSLEEQRRVLKSSASEMRRMGGQLSHPSSSKDEVSSLEVRSSISTSLPPAKTFGFSYNSNKVVHQSSLRPRTVPSNIPPKPSIAGPDAWMTTLNVFERLLFRAKILQEKLRQKIAELQEMREAEMCLVLGQAQSLVPELNINLPEEPHFTNNSQE